jgi:hypothetical protein
MPQSNNAAQSDCEEEETSFRLVEMTAQEQIKTKGDHRHFNGNPTHFPLQQLARRCRHGVSGQLFVTMD